MAHKQHRSAMLSYISHLAQTLFLKSCVSNRQYFVDHEDLRFKMGSNRECQPKIHSAGIVLDWRIDERVDFGKTHDIFELAANFSLLHSEDGSVEIDIFSSCELRVK